AAVPARQGQAPAVRVKRQGRNPAGLSAERGGHGAGARVPDLDASVRARRNQLPLGGEGQAPHGVLVLAEGTYFLVGLQIPQPYGPVLAGRGQMPAVRAESQLGDRILVPLEAVPHRAVQLSDQDAVIIAPGGEVPAIGTERDAVDVSVVRLRPAWPAGELLPGPPIPDPDASIHAGGSEIPAVGAVRHAHDRYRMRQLPRLVVAPPLEVVPFPAAQVGLSVPGATLVQQLLRPPQILGLQPLARRRA